MLPTERSEASDCDLCGPTIQLARGGALTLRHSAERDVAGLRTLYRQLEHSDLRRRFFTAGPPSTMFLDRWTQLRGEEGFGLVIELSDGDDAQLIGEAGYGRSGNDGEDYELGITVAPGSRGWVGPWLLDRLLAHAAERGIANLQAIVLTDNRAMLALAAKRGYAILGHPDRGLVRLIIATDGPVPSWPGAATRPRVLIETDRSRWIGEEALVAAGFDIALCDKTCGSGSQCPVSEGQACPLITGADAVIVHFHDAAAEEDLLNHEKIVHPGIRQIVVNDVGPGGVEGSGQRVDVDGVIDLIRDLLANEPD